MHLASKTLSCWALVTKSLTKAMRTEFRLSATTAGSVVPVQVYSPTYATKTNNFFFNSVALIVVIVYYQPVLNEQDKV